VIVCDPVTLGLYVSEHLAWPVVPVAASVQLPAPEKLPVLELEKLTVPVGVDFEPLPVSLTVAVQVVDASIASDKGEQATVVVVVRPAACAAGADASAQPQTASTIAAASGKRPIATPRLNLPTVYEMRSAYSQGHTRWPASLSKAKAGLGSPAESVPPGEAETKLGIS
jgi:hypothetical protein